MRYRSGHRRRSEGCGIKTKGGGGKKSLTLQIEMLKSLYNGLSVRSRYFILGIRVVQVKVMLYSR